MDRVIIRKNNQPRLLQNHFFNNLINKTIFVNLLEGRLIKGILKDFDNYALLVEIDSKDILIYKHAIKTVSSHIFIIKDDE